MVRHTRAMIAQGLKSLALALVATTALTSIAQAQPLPPVPVPPENPITEPKRVLGKILFWDEQLSHSNTVSCATCHQMTRAGSDARRARHPGFDNINNTPDDVQASPGVIRSDALRNYLSDAAFRLTPQVTNRSANSPINAAFAPELFWDGRAGSTFLDPDTGQVAIQNGGALENQIIGPPLSTVEMGHDSINWAQVTGKLQHAKPLALATNVPSDAAAALAINTNYPALFNAAFGSPQITARRIAFAIATYERTLIANQTPFDTGNLTPQQQQGLNLLGPGPQGHNCTVCHGGPLFTGNGFRNIGLRPPTEDIGRQAVTGQPGDLGRMKVPSLRNVALKNTFMHNGQFTTIQQVFGFYDRAPGTQQFPQNQDPVMAVVRMPPGDGGVVQNFLTTALVDPRVNAGQFPFDQATLYTQRPADQPTIVAAGVAGTGGIIPNLISADPAFVGNLDYRIGLSQALGGATAHLMISRTGPNAASIEATAQSFPISFLSGTGNGNGFATVHWPLKAPAVQQGQPLFVQWVVDDPGAVGGRAFSPVVRIVPFCGSLGCTFSCVGDYDNDHNVSIQDLFSFLIDWFAMDVNADINGQNGVSVQDIFGFLEGWFAGCPTI